jgi:hypothetical protein
VRDLHLFTRDGVTESFVRWRVQAVGDQLELYDANKYHISVVPTNPDGLLRFHWGEPISVAWRGPGNHSRRDWVGIYPVRYLSPSTSSRPGYAFSSWVPTDQSC